MSRTLGNFIVRRWPERLCDIVDSETTVCFFRIFTELTDGTIITQDIDIEGNPYAVQSVPQNVTCCDDGDSFRDLISIETNLNAGDTLSYAANSIHSISIYVNTGTLDINGVTLPTNAVRNISGDRNKNNILNAQNITNVTGAAFVVATQYV